MASIFFVNNVQKWEKYFFWNILEIENFIMTNNCKMTKKEYTLTFLEKVKDVREPARWFLVLLRYNVFNDEQVDELYQVFKNVVNSSFNEQQKRKLQKAINATDEIRKKEGSIQELEDDLDKILSEQ